MMIDKSPGMRYRTASAAAVIGVEALRTAAGSTQTDESRVEEALDELRQHRPGYSRMMPVQRAELLQECVERVSGCAGEWVELACRAKGIPAGSPYRAEEIVSGPVITVRYLKLLVQSLRDIDAVGAPRLPGRSRLAEDGRVQVPLVPCWGLYDPAVFISFKGHARMQEGVTLEEVRERTALHYPNGTPDEARVAVVLGAGNVSSIAATDVLSKLIEENCVVLLKMHPVTDYLAGIFRRAFAPLIERGFLRIVSGGAEVGATAVSHPQVETVHITGSNAAHETIVWGESESERSLRKQNQSPVLDKPISSELGNVTPWIVVPGDYWKAELRFQAENIAASLVNNAGFNCLATRVILTWKGWNERERFVERIEEVLRRVPRRKAYYPGALERYRRFSGREADAVDGTLPWTLLRDVDWREAPQLVGEESFVCVAAEIALEADDEREFLDRAVDFCNERLWGTLCAALTVPGDFRRRHRQGFSSAVSRLRYGNIGINQWPGINYAMVNLPWGGYAGGTLAEPQSGIGWVHNPYMLEGVEKSILEGPSLVLPKPVWLPTHRHPEAVVWQLLDLYRRPSVGKLSLLTWKAVGSVYG